jgi:hypothetical protein
MASWRHQREREADLRTGNTWLIQPEVMARRLETGRERHPVLTVKPNCKLACHLHVMGPPSMKEQRRRMRGWVETAASLVCCTDVEPGLFGEVLSEQGNKDRKNDALTISHCSCIPLTRGHLEEIMAVQKQRH